MEKIKQESIGDVFFKKEIDNKQQLSIEQCHIDLNIALKVPENIARRYTLVAIGLENHQLKVAMKEPFNMYALDDLRLITKLPIKPVLASKEEIEHLIQQVYTPAHMQTIVSKVDMQCADEKVHQPIVENDSDAPTIALLDNLLEICTLKGATDMHIEPFKSDVCIRYRIDGQLYILTKLNKSTLSAITTCIKVLAGLDIAERRMPQDGRISRIVNGQQVDLRISILPTIYGEKTVIRLFYAGGKNLLLTDMGFHPQDYEKLQTLLRNPHGIILVTGPTGSGKSTTLTAMLKTFNSVENNIITVEDPVENITEGINQVAVNNKIGLTFASVLKAILRQDPDIIMIGEMRDAQTSSIALRSAITGHLVLSTLHTNDAASAIVRLIDMGMEAYMVGAAVKGVVAQRLVRRLCEKCRKPHVVTKSEALLYKVPEGIQVYNPRGCQACHETGYKGRIAIHEVMMIDHELEDMISTARVKAEAIREKAIQSGMRTLWDNAYLNVLKGNTSLEEMLKVAYTP